MKKGLTNLYVRTGSDFSTIALESTAPLSHVVSRLSRLNYEVLLDGELIMAPDTINIYDGIINTINVSQKNGDAQVSILLQHPSSCRLKQVRGIPDRLEINFDRAFLKEIMKDKMIVIDPGHGGADSGCRGYINLLEKNVVMHIADYLKSKIIDAGGRAVLTREKDISVSLIDRLQVARLLEADIWISIHTRWDRDKSKCGARALYHTGKGELLCKYILEEIGKKLKLENNGICEESFSKWAGFFETKEDNIPFVSIEVCTISNPVEEGWLRSPVFKERAAQAIINGIARYFDSCLYEEYKNIYR